ncbi:MULTISPECIES: polyamine aminopropyltransferase [Thiomicrorhabdus]|uniref:Polyamine aminopropyltransferase n=1 Tax=Thiomicrorhabdus xiamenensis TaxID=2739063 RepID=A0A7D4T1J4_9GAMM|nr:MULTISPECIES: polyamine aminopropyltransferase [Thiomicrorhabdus]MBO1923206.1 polyamine aminopropyltransferase [Thiomicrorhabdus sp. 6S3-12]QKI89982.1 polyamine aminopropyltransferase [Thiomicrorhabdus xiamenensis]
MSQQTYLETLYPTWGQSFVMNEVLFEVNTGHQHLIIFKNEQWGTVMALDGVIQTTEKDEFVYHEMMVHVPMMAHGNAKKVLIIGGGDGGILREVLKHENVDSVTQVEIDQQVIDMCVKYLPNHSAGAYDNPKANIVIADGVDFVNECTEKFDVIISDSTDPMGPGEVLFTSRFYQGIKNCLNDGGVFVAQNGVSFMQTDEVSTTHKRLSPLFAQASFYSGAVPTYVGGIMTFAWATDNLALKEVSLETLQQRFKQSGIKTRFYTPEVHKGAFALPQYVLDAIA